MFDEIPNALPKGTRVFARRLGKADIRGQVTWVGPSRYGDGHRYGVRADDGSTHWVDEADITPEAVSAAAGANAIQRGTRVRVIDGPHAGVEGEVYIASAAGRFGVRDDDEETCWVEEKHLERV